MKAKDIKTMDIIQTEKAKETGKEARTINPEVTALARSKMFSIDVATTEPKVDPLR